MSTMTLKQVSHMLRCASQDMVNPRYRNKFKVAADAIDAHLTSREANGEAVGVVKTTIGGWGTALLTEKGQNLPDGTVLYTHHAAQEAAKPVERAKSKRAVFEDANARDAWRYRRLRSAPVGVPGVPCIAVPASAMSGEYVNAEQADAAVDEAEMPKNDVVVAYIETTPSGSQGLVWADHPANTEGHVFTPLVVGGQPKPEQAVGDGGQDHVAEVTHLYSDNYGHHHRIKWVNHYDNAFPVGTKLYVRPRPAVATPAEVTEEMVEAVGSALYIHWPDVNEQAKNAYRKKVRDALTTALAAQPSTVGVPEELDIADAGFNGADERERGYVEGWNACRKSLIATTPEPTHD